MPPFGQKKLEAEIDRLMALLPPAADLAAELMPAFGPDEPNGGQDLSKNALADWVLRKYEHNFTQQAIKALRVAQRLRVTGLERPILEAVQLLWHAELVYESRRTEYDGYWSATQLGLAALANGDYRQRIRNRTGAVAAPPEASVPVTPPQLSIAQRLQELETLRATGAISDAEYAAKREQIINQI